MRLGKDKQFKYINGYDAPDILAGQGTLGLEILEQVGHYRYEFEKKDKEKESEKQRE